ncbi:ABC transporter, fused ATPase domains, partial [Oceanicola granulosus HTCC2516]
MLAALSGELRTKPGMVRFKGDDIGRRGPNERSARALLPAPEERMGHAAAPDMSLT